MNFHRNLGVQRRKVLTSLGTQVLSCGVHLPLEKVKSSDLFESFHSERDYGIDKNWMSNQMGILERRFSPMEERPSDLAIKAAREALDSISSFNPDNIDAVLFCGIERDQPEPATAHQVQRSLGLRAKFVFDVANACFGLFDGIQIASSLIRAGAARSVLVTTGEVPTRLTREVVSQLSKGMDAKKARDVLGFLTVGDAGAAMIVGESDADRNQGFLSFDCQSLSEYNNLCYYDHNKHGEFEGQMKMARIVSRTLKLQKEIRERANYENTMPDPRFLLTHQVGKKAFDQVSELGLVPERNMIKSYDYFGNVTSATVGLNFYQLINSGRLKSGDTTYACYSGSGIVAGQFYYKH